MGAWCVLSCRPRLLRPAGRGSTTWGRSWNPSATSSMVRSRGRLLTPPKLFCRLVTGVVVAPLHLSALQSPIEYQRRESKSNSLGRSMRPPLYAASALRPHSSASIDRHKRPSLQSHNISLPSLYLPSQGQAQGAGDTFSSQNVSVLLVHNLNCNNKKI